jgi:hypothetical protein
MSDSCERAHISEVREVGVIFPATLLGKVMINQRNANIPED